MEEKKQVPQIRFKGYVDAWEQRKLKEISKEVNRNDPTSTAPVMMITANNGFIEQSERYAFNNAGESLKKYILLEKGELAYNHGASKLRPYGSCFALTNAENARVPFVYHCFNVGENDSEFVSIELNGAEIERQLRKIVSSGARMDGLLNISYEEYGNLALRMPSIKEQHMISNFFRNFDHLITLHQRKYDKLVNIKKSMLEKMFPKNGRYVPEIRFKGFTDAWEQRKLGELGTITTGSTPSTSISDYYSDDGIVWVTPTDISENIIFESAKKLSNLGQQVARVVPKNTILVTCIASIGKNTMLGNTGSFNQQINGLTPNENKYDPYFLLTESALWSAKMKSSAAAGTMQIINRTEFSELKTWLPSLTEQRHIGTFFRNLDSLITLHQRKLEKLKNIKKSMLDKMFV